MQQITEERGEKGFRCVIRMSWPQHTPPVEPVTWKSEWEADSREARTSLQMRIYNAVQAQEIPAS